MLAMPSDLHADRCVHPSRRRHLLFFMGELGMVHSDVAVTFLAITMFAAGAAAGTFCGRRFTSLPFWTAVDTSVVDRAAPLRWSRGQPGTGGTRQPAEAVVVWLDPAQSESVRGVAAGLPAPPSKPQPCPERGSALLVAGGGRTSLCTGGYALRLIPGRLGNALVGAAYMLAIAEATGSVALFPEKPSALDVLLGLPAENATRPAVLHDFTASGSAPRACASALVEDGFFPTRRSMYLGVNATNVTLADRARLLRTHLRPHLRLRPNPPAPGTLVVHIRGGDIMREEPKLWGGELKYVQPPLAFYQRVVTARNFTRVLIVCEDHRNPTADALAAWRPDLVTFSSGELADDVATILGATHLALAYGTFAWMLAFLGDAQQLYVPCMPFCSVTYTCDEIPLAATCYKFPRYIEPGNWHNTPEQRALMLNYSDGNIVEEQNRLSR